MRKIIASLILLVLIGCKASDSEIRADIASKARNDLNFAGLIYTVENGAVSITGNCPSQKAFQMVKQKVKNIHVIKSVNYKVAIAPVRLDTLTSVKLHADSVLVKYPQVIAEVSNAGITLRGAVTAAQRSGLISDARLKLPGNVKDSVFVIPK